MTCGIHFISFYSTETRDEGQNEHICASNDIDLLRVSNICHCEPFGEKSDNNSKRFDLKLRISYYFSFTNLIRQSIKDVEVAHLAQWY